MRAFRQPRKWKFGVPLTEIAQRTGFSLSKVKRLSAKNPELIAAMLQSKPTTGQDELIDLLDCREEVIWQVHFHLCAIAPPESDLRVTLKPVFDLTGPVIDEITEEW